MRRIVVLALFLCLALAGAGARADDIEVREADLRFSEEGLLLSADFAFELNPRLAEAVGNGIPLYFLVEFELNRPRWYWFDEKTLARQMQLRLSYHPLSRQYRLSTGLLQQSFPSLEEALGVLRRVRNWLLADRSSVFSEAEYEASLRMRLDRTLLPKPFQISTLTSSEWRLESQWKKFPLRLGPQTPAPVESRDSSRTEAR